MVYPTAASYYYAPRVSRTPPQWTSGFNWIDQNSSKLPVERVLFDSADAGPPASLAWRR